MKDVVVGAKKDCCKVQENLYIDEQRPDLVVYRCKLCDCRHFELSVSPGKIGLQGGEIG